MFILGEALENLVSNKLNPTPVWGTLEQVRLPYKVMSDCLP